MALGYVPVAARFRPSPRSARPGAIAAARSRLTASGGRIAAQEAHIESLQAWLAATEQRASRAEERAEKAEQRLIDELARLAAGQHTPTMIDDTDKAEMLAELAAEFDTGRHLMRPASLLPSEFSHSGEGSGSDAQTASAEAAPSEANPVSAVSPISEPNSELTEPAPNSRRIWWFRFMPRRRRST
jgi:hypothetical protein